MITTPLSNQDIEQSYDLIAEAIDSAGEGRERLFLAKLAITLAGLLGNPAQIAEAVRVSLRDL